MIESFLLDNLIVARDKKDSLIFSPEKTLIQHIEDFRISNRVDSIAQRINKIVVSKTASADSVIVEHSNFKEIDNQIFPFTTQINIQQTKDTLSLHTYIGLKYSKVSFPKSGVTFPFSIPEKYVQKK